MAHATIRQQWFLFLFLLGIGVLNTANLYFGWYRDVPLVDMPLHFLGGAWVALATLFFGNPKQKMVCALFSVFVIGVSWEIFELWASWLGSGEVRIRFLDTGKDIFFNFLGAYIALCCTRKSS